MSNIFKDDTKMVPTGDSQIVRVNMEELEIGGRKSHLPGGGKATDMSIAHVPNAGTKG